MNKEEFLSLAEQHYEEVASLNEEPTLYDYEKSLAALVQKMGHEIMEKQLGGGAVITNRRKKKR